jgi:glycosyltransferase involved in cell wall biosynthesis
MIPPSCTPTYDQRKISSAAKRVLYLVNLNPCQKFGTLEEQIFLIAKALSQEGGVLVPVFTREINDVQGSRYRQAGLPIEALDLQSFQLSAFRKLLRLIDHYRVGWLHWHMYSTVNLYVLLLRLVRPGVRHIFTDHSSRASGVMPAPSVWKSIKRRFLGGCYSGMYAVSDYVLKDLQAQGFCSHPRRYYHFVNTDRFQPDAEVRARVRASMGCEDRLIILVVAHLIPEKGVDVAIRALAELPSRAVLWIAGDGPERQRLADLAHAIGVEARVQFLGLHSDVSQFLRAADCFVCPSLWQEAAGLVILEAMACGLPVIASSVGGIPEFVTPGETGYLYSAGDAHGLADHLTALSSDPSRLAHLSLRARARVLNEFSHTTRVADALSLYNPQS